MNATKILWGQVILVSAIEAAANLRGQTWALPGTSRISSSRRPFVPSSDDLPYPVGVARRCSLFAFLSLTPGPTFLLQMRAVFEGRPSSTISILAAIHSRDDFRMSPRSRTLLACWAVRSSPFPPAIFCDGANLHTLIAAYGTRSYRAPRVYFKYSFPYSAILGRACGVVVTGVQNYVRMNCSGLLSRRLRAVPGLS